MTEDASFLLNRFSIDMSMVTQTLATTIVPVIWGKNIIARKFSPSLHLPYQCEKKEKQLN